MRIGRMGARLARAGALGALLGAAGGATAAVAQTMAATEDLGLSVTQGGRAVPLEAEVDPNDGGILYAVALDRAPFELRLPPDACPPEAAGTMIRVTPGDVAETLRAALTASGLAGSDLTALAFPPGFGMADDPGPMTALQVGAPDAGGSPFEQPFNYVWGDRYGASSAKGDVIAVERVMLPEGDAVAAGRPFTLLIGRGECEGVAGRMPVEVVRVGFGG